jgi:hypothetical protein
LGTSSIDTKATHAISVPTKIKEESAKESTDAKGKAKNIPTASTTASANTTNPSSAKKGPVAAIVAEGGGRPRSRTNTSSPTAPPLDPKKPLNRSAKKKEEEGIPEEVTMNEFMY